MDLISTLLIAVGLSMDAFAVSISSGIIVRDIKFGYGLKVASSFGSFQAVMPVAGWIAGRSLVKYIEPVDHWIAFILLDVIAFRMIINSFKNNESPGVEKLSGKTLLMLSLATSMDALAVGLSLSFIKFNILIPAVIIGCVTFFNSMVGMFIGKKVGHKFGKKAEFFGALILIFIAFRILISHLSQ